MRNGYFHPSVLMSMLSAIPTLTVCSNLSAIAAQPETTDSLPLNPGETLPLNEMTSHEQLRTQMRSHSLTITPPENLAVHVADASPLAPPESALKTELISFPIPENLPPGIDVLLEPNPENLFPIVEETPPTATENTSKPPQVTQRPFPKGQCTWYVAYRSREAGWMLQFSQNWVRHARYWWDMLINGNKGEIPRPGAIMVLDGEGWNGYGHVAFVEEVISPDRWVVTHTGFRHDPIARRVEGVPIYRSTFVRVPGGVRLSNGRNVYPFRGFLYPPEAGLE